MKIEGNVLLSIIMIFGVLIGVVAGLFVMPAISQWTAEKQTQREFDALMSTNVDYQFMGTFEGRVPEVRVLFVDNSEKMVAAFIIVDEGSKVPAATLLRTGFLTLAEIYPDKDFYSIVLCAIQRSDYMIDGPATLVLPFRQDVLLAEGLDTLISAGPIPCTCVYIELIEAGLYVVQEGQGQPVTQEQLLKREPGYIWPWEE